jgi:hypothetical protein
VYRLPILALEFLRSLSFGEGVGRIRRRFSFSVIRRPALVPAEPAVSCRVALAIGGARPAPEGTAPPSLSAFSRAREEPVISWRRVVAGRWRLLRGRC